MTDERFNTDAGDVDDPLVSKAYRELSRERAPASLSERILRDSRAAAAPGYSRSVAWLRPMAWAATIGLCLAIVAELATTPMMDATLPADELAAITGRLESGFPAAELEDRNLPQRVSTLPEPDKVQRDIESRDETKLEPIPPQATSPASVSVAGSPVAEEEVTVSGSRRRELPAAAVEPADERQQARRAALAAEARSYDSPADEDVLRTAASHAFARSDDSPIEEAGEMAQMRMELDAAAAATAEGLCPDSVRDTPERWHACIETLEKTGFVDDALREREQLKEAFPDFDLPAAR